MALIIKDILQLPSTNKFQLVSGEKGLNNFVISVGIVDYEFLPNIGYPLDTAFEKDSFVISSLLFAHNNPSAILKAVIFLFESGVTGLAYKNVLFKELPKEVLDFSNKNSFPIFSFDETVFFENIIFDIMDAVQLEDDVYLTEENIKKMINSSLSKSELFTICKGISLELKQYASVTFIASSDADFIPDIARIHKTFYSSKGLNAKALFCKYGNGLFFIITSAFPEMEKHLLILQEVMEFLSISKENFVISSSEVHLPFEDLDLCFKESYHCFIASKVEKQDFDFYKNIDTYKFIIPLMESPDLYKFAQEYLKPLENKPEYYNTATLYTQNHGDMLATSIEMDCHLNTIRYRLSKIKEFVGDDNKTEFEFYKNLRTALMIVAVTKRV